MHFITNMRYYHLLPACVSVLIQQSEPTFCRHYVLTCFACINNYQFQQNHHKTVITENCCLQKIVTQFDYKLNRWIQTVKLRNLFNLWPPKRKSQKYLVTFLNSQLNRFHLYLCTFFADKLQKKICITHTHTILIILIENPLHQWNSATVFVI